MVFLCQKHTVETEKIVRFWDSASIANKERNWGFKVKITAKIVENLSEEGTGRIIKETKWIFTRVKVTSEAVC
jgi:hypothetical protein